MPIERPTSVSPLSSAIRTPTLSRSEERSTVRACPGGSVTVLTELVDHRCRVSVVRRRQGLTVLGVNSIRPRDMSSLFAKASAISPSKSSAKRFSPGHSTRQNISDLIQSSCSTPLEQFIVLVKQRQLVLNHGTWPITASWHTVAHLRNHRRVFQIVICVGAVDDNEPVVRLVQRSCPRPTYPTPPCTATSYYQYLSVFPLQPRPPQLHSPSILDVMLA